MRATSEQVRTRIEKRCGRCQLTKPLTEFHRSKQTGDGRKNRCKLCERKDSRDRYAQDASSSRIRSQRRHQERRAFIDSHKQDPCPDCTQSYPVHHRDPSTKVCEVACLIHAPLEQLVDEIDKCDVLCANCHIIRHISEENFGI